MSASVEGQKLVAEITDDLALPSSPQHLSPDAFNRLVRSRLTPRGRFAHDHHDTATYIARSKNANVVAYTVNLVDAATQEPVPSGEGRDCVVKAADPVHAYFVNLEPSYLENRRAKNIPYDCDNLNMLERRLAYGCSAIPLLHNALLNDLKRSNEHVRQQLEANAELEETVVQWWGAARPYMVHYVALPTWPAVLLCLPPLNVSQPTVALPSELPATEGERAADRSEEAEEELGAAQPPQPTEEGAPQAPPPSQDQLSQEPQLASPPTEEKESGGAEKCEEPSESSALPTGSCGGADPPPSSPVQADNDTVVAVLAKINGELCVVDKVYVKSIEPKRFYQLPTVEYIDVFGISLLTGEAKQERKTK